MTAPNYGPVDTCEPPALSSGDPVEFVLPGQTWQCPHGFTWQSMWTQQVGGAAQPVWTCFTPQTGSTP